MGSPPFSVVIPTFNRAHLIGKTISTVLRQDFPEFELLVIDDGSKDNTEEVVLGFRDDRIQFYRKENAERGAARNYGAARAKGAYINFFDSDDLMHSNHLGAANQLLATADKPEFIHMAYDIVLSDGTLLNKVNAFDDTIRRAVLFDNKLSCNGVFLRRDIATAFPFDEERALASSEDWALWIKLLSRFQLHFSNEITSSVVNHDRRSLFTISAEKVVARDLLLIDKLRRDPVVLQNYGSAFNRFVADRYTFFMLCYAERRQAAKVLEWGIRALRVYPPILAGKRFLASIKNSLWR